MSACHLISLRYFFWTFHIKKNSLYRAKLPSTIAKSKLPHIVSKKRKNQMFRYEMWFRRNPVYCSLSTNNPPPYFFVQFLCQVKVRVRKEVQFGACRVKAAHRCYNWKKTKNKIRGRGYLCSKSKTRESPVVFAYIIF